MTINSANNGDEQSKPNKKNATPLPTVTKPERIHSPSRSERLSPVVILSEQLQIKKHNASKRTLPSWKKRLVTLTPEAISWRRSHSRPQSSSRSGSGDDDIENTELTSIPVNDIVHVYPVHYENKRNNVFAIETTTTTMTTGGGRRPPQPTVQYFRAKSAKALAKWVEAVTLQLDDNYLDDVRFGRKCETVVEDDREYSLWSTRSCDGSSSVGSSMYPPSPIRVDVGKSQNWMLMCESPSNNGRVMNHAHGLLFAM
eukprot:CAMPEP_0172507564 /NCGR_PEP_ID=MMETSP1066-20121228/204688_1 /TAXON_ID=671091 /ORGANISM="Coscinodiscus wailesii, Strain CCMP2513" /LENGTH=255 /DNA_ID=CAMNT_0013285147 /DNA_START=106 /DNA_END=873 /DNA_ORIENTATION=+